MRVNYECFHRKPGEVEEQLCEVCGTVCNVRRNENSPPISWAGAVARKNRIHDYFFCPNVEAEWHKTALRLVLEIEATASKSLRALLDGDLADIIKEKGKDKDA